MAGPTMVRDLPRRRTPGRGVGKKALGHQIGHQGDRGRKLKGAGRPEQDEYAKEEERICAALQRKRQKEHSAQRLNDDA